MNDSAVFTKLFKDLSCARMYVRVNCVCASDLKFDEGASPIPNQVVYDHQHDKVLEYSSKTLSAILTRNITHITKGNN